MTDKEKVLNGLETCTDLFQLCKNGCPYYDSVALPKCNQLKKDALALLRELDEQNRFLMEQNAAYYKVLNELREVGYPHNFQLEPLWIVQYMQAITRVVSEAYEVLKNDPD